jgi:hypothetical protein
MGQCSSQTPERAGGRLGRRPRCSMLWWMRLVADEREGTFSTWPWERVRCACSSSPTARFLRGTATTVSLTSTRRFGHVAFQRQRTCCDARRESASITAFAAGFRCVSTGAFGCGTTQRTRLSSRVLLWGRRFPSWSTRVIRASSTPSVTSNTGQTPGPLPCSGTGSSWCCLGWPGLHSSSGCDARQCPGPDGPTVRPASCAVGPR